ncbi:1-phosphofructokinase family hexose kinase [Nocardiopsis oceani]
MILTITPNPAIDLTITTPVFAPGTTHVVPPAHQRAGGKGLNVARVLSQTGFTTRAIAPVGHDDAAWFAADLGQGAETDLLPCAGATRRTYALVESETGRTSMVTESGPERTDAEWRQFIDLVKRNAHKADTLVLSGSLPPAHPGNLVSEIVGLGHGAGARVIADVNGRALVSAARAGAHTLKPNLDELRAATGATDPVTGARTLQREGAGLVIVSLGEEGMLAVPADRAAAVLHARLGRTLQGNPTGAGDAAVAALATGGTRAELPEVLRRAVAWSAAAVLAPLAGTLHESYPDLRHEVVVSEI